jgi:intracellular multiplication protein IcmF
MDNSLQLLCDNLKKIISQLKPQNTPLSFVLLTGKSNQGKTELLKQSSLHHYPIDEESHANIFYNNQGIILELGETWLSISKSLLAHSLKQLNRCHPSVKISGIILCIEATGLLEVDPLQLIEHCKAHTHLVERFAQALGHPIDTALMITKLDSLAGFCDFFQSEHEQDLKKPLGFSIDSYKLRSKLIVNYKTQFDQMIEVLGQRIIQKLHPARSSVKRTLIREFPLQLASLLLPIQTIIQQLASPSFKIQAIYFSSALQGGISVDKLNQKIQHEYALTVQDKFPQSTNFRAYFIEGALQAFQANTMHYTTETTKVHKALVCLGIAFVGIFAGSIAHQYIRSSSLLDSASQELLAYDALNSENKSQTVALYHLSRAENQLASLPKTLLSHTNLDQLKEQLHKSSQHKLQTIFFPYMVSILEKQITNSSLNQLEKYQALKIYLMLAEKEHYSEKEIKAWFHNYWEKNQANQLNDKDEFLLLKTLQNPLKTVTLNNQIISDTRNHLNALPPAYLYYSLAKTKFSQEKIPLQIAGFELASREIPMYFTKEGFKKITSLIPSICNQLQQENWILARQDLQELQKHIEEAYYFDYANWWKQFVKNTRPHRFQNYKQVQELMQTLYQHNSLTTLTQFVQAQTGPELHGNATVFNQKISNQFTGLNLLMSSATYELNQNIHELEKFLSTLSLVNDQGKTIFEVTKTRFKENSASDPLSSLYNKFRQLPEPLGHWAQQVADQTWYIFITESKNYLNTEWKKQIYPVYKNTIAHHFPLDSAENEEIQIHDFDNFFSPNGKLNVFANQFLKPFLDTTHPQWKPKELNGYIMPISDTLINELIRSNVISNMFFPDGADTSKIEFSLQKINLDPVVSTLQLTIGKTTLTDNQNSDSDTFFTWPQTGAKLSLHSIQGDNYELEESGPWAFFKMLQKVNVLVDNNDSSSLQILFEINGNSGRYLLKTQNQINPFSPGILTGFVLEKRIV